MTRAASFRHLPRRPRSAGSHTLAPLVDVVLLLLIFILVSARFDRSEVLEVNLPEVRGGGETVSSPSERRRITVFADGSVAWNEERLSLDALRTRLAAEPPESRLIPIVVRGDAEVSLGEWMPVLALLGELGFATANVGVRSETAPSE